MKKIVNLRPWKVEIAATGQAVEAGGTVEVDDDLAESLCEQPDNWKPATGGKKKTRTSKEGDQ